MKINRIMYAALLILLIGGVVISCSKSEVPPEQKLKIEGVVKDYLTKNPEVVILALQSYQQKQMDQAEKSIEKTKELSPKFANELFRENNDPIVGNPNGIITITQFFDYQCPHCAHMVPVIDALIKANPNVRFVYKEFPIRGADSEKASRAALAAKMQGKYLAFHEALMNEHAKGLLDEAVIFKVAQAAGLNVQQLKTDMNNALIEQQIKNNTKLGQSLQLIGTPAYFIAKTDISNNADAKAITFIPGQVDQDKLQVVIDKLSK